MNIRSNILLTFIFFCLLPFIYFYIVIGSHSQLLSYPEIVYPVFFLLALLFSYIIEKNLRHELQAESKQQVIIIAGTCVILYALYLFIVTWYMYSNFFSQGVDLEYFFQTIWQLSEFKVPYIWALNQPLFAVWSQHFSPFLYLLVPVMWLSHSAGALLMVQAIVIISGAIPIYLIAKRSLHSRGLGLALSFAYLSFGGLQFGMEYGFHEIMFFPTVFLWAYYFYVVKKPKLYLLFVILSLLIKEEVAFIVFFWGLYLMFFRKDKFWGTITTILGMLWYIVCFNIVFPYFNKGFGYWGQYDTDGSSGLLGILKSTLFKPFNFLVTLVTPELKIQMMLETFGQFAFLLLLFPPTLLIIFPSLMEKLLSSGIAMGNGAHYSAAICAMTIISTFEAIPHIYKNKLVTRYIHNKNIFFIVLISYSALFSSVILGFPDYSLAPNHGIYFLETPITDANKALLTQIISEIPANATVASNDPLPPHLNKYYKDSTDFPGVTGKEDFIIVDTQFRPVYGYTAQEYNDAIDKLNKNKNYQLAVSNIGILVYRRKTFNANSVQQ